MQDYYPGLVLGIFGWLLIFGAADNLVNFICSVLMLRRQRSDLRSRAPVFHCKLIGHLPHLHLHLLHQHRLLLLLLPDHLHHPLNVFVLLQEGRNHTQELGAFATNFASGGSTFAGPIAGHVRHLFTLDILPSQSSTPGTFTRYWSAPQGNNAADSAVCISTLLYVPSVWMVTPKLRWWTQKLQW